MFKDKLVLFFNEIKLNKKYISLYLVFICVSFFAMMRPENYASPKAEILIFIIVAILGIFLINYYTLEHDLFKVSFVVILCFGLICACLMPIFDAPDEEEHFQRAFLTSQGDFFPTYHEGQGFNSIQSVFNLFDNRFNTIIDTNIYNQPINNTFTYYNSAFAQNPFFGYLAQGLGILIAEALSLNQIWMLWLARFFNVLLYAILASYAIRKTPVAKELFLVMACIPLAIYQISSASIDATISGLSLIAIAYLFSMVKSDTKISNKEIAVFSCVCLLLGLCKVTYFAFIFLLLFIPQNKFEKKKQFFLCISAIVILAVIAILWTKYYANPGILRSYRLNYMIENNVNSTAQAHYLLTHPSSFIMSMNFALNNVNFIVSSMFDFSIPHECHVHNSDFITPIYQFFLGALIFLYPLKEKFSNKFKIGLLAIIVMIYFGTFIVQLLSWTPVGNIYILGVQPRYFISIFILLPFIFNFSDKFEVKTQNIDKYVFVLVLGFLAATVLCLITGCY